MIHGVPHQVGKRIFDGFDDGAVQVGLFAFHFDPDFLAAVERQIAHGAGKLVPDIADGLHAGAHDLFLQFAGDEIHALRERLKAGVLGAIGELQQLVARQHQFAHQVHEPVEQGDADANGFDSGVGIAGLKRALRRLHILLAGGALINQNISNAFSAFFLLLESVRQSVGTYLSAFQEQPADLGRVRQEIAGHRFEKNGGRSRRRSRHGCGGTWGLLRGICGRDRNSVRGRWAGLQPLQARQVRDERGIVFIPVLARGLNRGKHFANRVHHGQQSAGDFLVQRQFAIAQAGEQVFARMRQLFQPGETQKPAAALDGVDSPEDARQKFFGGRIGFQLHQFLVQPVQDSRCSR